jgi:hypothetical protein
LLCGFFALIHRIGVASENVGEYKDVRLKTLSRINHVGKEGMNPFIRTVIQDYITLRTLSISSTFVGKE